MVCACAVEELKVEGDGRLAVNLASRSGLHSHCDCA